MTVTAAAEKHLIIIWLMLQFASVGVLEHAGIKVPFLTFFGEDSGIRTKEPPINMRIAMGIAAFLCIFLGVYPQPLYAILPYPVEFVPYTGFHVVSQLLLLSFGILAFILLMFSGYFPAELRAKNLDTDWFLRKPGTLFVRFCKTPVKEFFGFFDRRVMGVVRYVSGLSRNPFEAPRVLTGFESIDSEKNYDENAYRLPIGLGVSIALIILFIWVLINFKWA